MAKKPKVGKVNNREINKFLSRITWVVLVFAAVGLVISAVEHKEGKLVNDVFINIEVLPDGNKLIKEDDVLITIERAFGYNLPGLPLGAVNVERLERVLNEDPFVTSAEVYVDATNDVNIYIKQRRPILRIADNNGLNYYLDEHGAKMPLSKHFSPRVIAATGNVAPHTPDFMDREEHNLKNLFLLAKMILEDEFLRPMIEQIHVSNRREFILIPKMGRQEIVFGTFDHADEKLANIKAFYKEGLPYAGWQKYKTFNVKYKGQVVAEKK